MIAAAGTLATYTAPLLVLVLPGMYWQWWDRLFCVGVAIAIAHVCCAWSVEVGMRRVSVSMPALVQIIRFGGWASVTAAAGPIIVQPTA